MKLILLFLVLVLTAALLSCGTHRTLGYIEDYTDTTGKDTVVYFDHPIQKNDVLSIQVYSASTIPGSDDIYNLPNTGGTVSSGALRGFLVDNNGYIEYPRIGFIKAEGLTKSQLADTIKNYFVQSAVLINPTVIVRLLNFKVTMMGEVGSPGPITVPGERLNLFEAIGLAGDLTLYAKKKEVRVIREVNGIRELGIVDLTSKDIFDSPYYQLAQNDIVIVQPTKNKERLNEQLFAQRISLGLSIISSIALLYNIFR